jgi:hypothetical protein
VKIESYSFGKMVVDGRVYRNDLIICGGEVLENWRRESGHTLRKRDLGWLLERDPDLLLIGKGKNGRMSVPEETERELKEAGVKVRIADTEEAVRIFNKKREDSSYRGKLAGAFHLTC